MAQRTCERRSDRVTLAFAEPGVDFPPQHYAFLVSDEEFDALLERIVAREIAHWADPKGRRGSTPITVAAACTFDDASGHHLEAITRRYASAAAR